jgi:hypothetical protein
MLIHGASRTWRRRLAAGAICVLLDITIGLALGALGWWLVLAGMRNSFAAALEVMRGNLDALDHGCIPIPWSGSFPRS